MRLYIHGIPLHVDEREIEQWVDTFATRVSGVEAVQKTTPLLGAFLNGNRYCYISKILEPKPRYSTFDMQNPCNPTQLIATNITMYYEGQTVNCKLCKDESHTIEDCPARRRPTSNLETVLKSTTQILWLSTVNRMLSRTCSLVSYMVMTAQLSPQWSRCSSTRRP